MGHDRHCWETLGFLEPGRLNEEIAEEARALLDQCKKIN
jgi:hypothetical protein